MLRLFRFGVSKKKQQKPKKKLQNLHFIPFLISSTTVGGPYTPSSTLPPDHIRKFLSLDRFHIRQLRGHDDLTASRLRTRSQVGRVKAYTRYVQQRHTVDGSEIRPKTKKTVNNGINYQPQLVSRSSEPSTTVQYTWRFWF